MHLATAVSLKTFNIKETLMFARGVKARRWGLPQVAFGKKGPLSGLMRSI